MLLWFNFDVGLYYDMHINYANRISGMYTMCLQFTPFTGDISIRFGFSHLRWMDGVLSLLV